MEKSEESVLLAVCGAHLSGMALHPQLSALNAVLVETTTTAPDYRLYALGGMTPPRPGLERVCEGQGHKIVVEVWALSHEAFGRFVEMIPAPMAIGMNRLASGAWVKGFLAEPIALQGGTDISHYGGWRSFMAATADA